MTAIRGVIDRRILVNFRVEIAPLERFLPDPFRPKVVNGYGIAGICLIRLKQIRPVPLPRWMGIGSENAAHRVAVQWDEGESRTSGVYVPRRDTNSRLNTLLGGRLFPGVHHHASFDVIEAPDSLTVRMQSDDREAYLYVKASISESLSQGSIFNSVSEASNFFEEGSLGYSPGRTKGRYEGMELRTLSWRVTPLQAHQVESTFFSREGSVFAENAKFDCALLMTGIEHEWHSRDSLYCDWPT